MAWLTRGDEVLATVEIAETRAARARGLLGREDFDGAMLLRPARSVHTIRMRFPVDVAYCDRGMKVLRLATMRPNRIGRPTWRARCVVEVPAGAFDKWRLRVGDQLEVRT